MAATVGVEPGVSFNPKKEVLQTTRSTTGLGTAGYVMKAEVITPYKK